MTWVVAPFPEGFAEALDTGAEALFDLMARRFHSHVGDVLLTVLVPDTAKQRLVRVYSSDARRYPLGDADLFDESRWFYQLFIRREPVVANTEDEIAEWLPDFAEFESHGYASLANLPILAAGEVIGIVNVMSGRNQFTETRIRRLQAELPTAALAIMMPRAREVHRHICDAGGVGE